MRLLPHLSKYEYEIKDIFNIGLLESNQLYYEANAYGENDKFYFSIVYNPGIDPTNNIKKRV